MTAIAPAPAPAQTPTPARGSYRAPHWHDALLHSLPDRLVRPGTRRWIARLPMVVVGAVLAVLALRLHNGASADEAVAVTAGRELIAGWIGQPGDGVPAGSLPGAAFPHPVLVAALESAGGLLLVRVASLGFVLAAMVLLAGATAVRFSHRAGVFSAAAFALSAPVVLVADLGTADAPALACLAAALWAVAARTGTASALAAGGLLVLAALVQHSAAVLVPVVLVAGAAMAGASRALRRTLLAGGTVVLGAGVLQLLGAGPGARAWTDLVGDAPLSPHTWTGLAGWLLLDIGVLLALAVVGAVRLVAAGGRDLALVGALLAGAAVHPAAQLWTGDGVTFDRDLAYSALFLAPLAGIALTRMSRGTWRLGPVLLVLPVLVLFGVSRSGVVSATWPDVRPVAAAIAEDPTAGRYLASGPATEALEYHTSDLPAVEWEDTYALYAGGEDAVRVAVEDLRYEAVVLHSASTGSPAEDAMEDVVRTALRDNGASYDLVAAIPASDDPDADVWLVYRQVP